jgi:hypothetical protein
MEASLKVASLKVMYTEPRPQVQMEMRPVRDSVARGKIGDAVARRTKME